jgi:hypothetical protein
MDCRKHQPKIRNVPPIQTIFDGILVCPAILKPKSKQVQLDNQKPMDILPKFHFTQKVTDLWSQTLSGSVIKF